MTPEEICGILNKHQYKFSFWDTGVWELTQERSFCIRHIISSELIDINTAERIALSYVQEEEIERLKREIMGLRTERPWDVIGNIADRIKDDYNQAMDQLTSKLGEAQAVIEQLKAELAQAQTLLMKRTEAVMHLALHCSTFDTAISWLQKLVETQEKTGEVK